MLLVDLFRTKLGLMGTMAHFIAMPHDNTEIIFEEKTTC